MTKDARTALIGEGLRALLANGYDGVGLAAILGAAGVPKGSFYHFFRSKEDFAGAVLDAYEQHYIELRQSILGDVTQSPLARLRSYFATVFATWDAQFERVLIAAQAAGEMDPQLNPRAAAAFLIEAYEGALIRMKVDGGSAAFERFRTFALGPLSRGSRRQST